MAGQNAVLDPDNRFAAFHPRIDCATFANDRADCLAIVTRQTGDSTESTSVVALRQATGAAGWGTRTNLVTSNSSVHLASDVAVSPAAEEFFYTRVSENNAVVTINATSLLISEPVISASLGYRAAFPPRVSYNDDIGGVLVLGAQAITGLAPRWILHKVVKSGLTLTVTQLNFGTLDDSTAENSTAAIIGDFDFDCRTLLFGSSTCAVVAVLARLPSVNALSDDPGRLWSRRFSVSGNTVTVADAQWLRSVSDVRAQAVIGVSLATDNRMFVSFGRQQSGSGLTTRDREYATPDVSIAATLTNDSDTDVNLCTTGTSHGFTMSPRTPHGGTSIDYCPMCGNGRIESLRFGALEGDANADTFCF